MELFANLRAHFITTAVDAGTNRRLARVKHSRGAVFGVDEDNGKAVGGLNADQQSRSRRDQSIAKKLSFRRSVDEVDDVGMKLTQRHQWPGLRACSAFPPIASSLEFLEKRGAVAFDCCLGIARGESQVESAASEGARESAHARGKTMNEPGEFA